MARAVIIGVFCLWVWSILRPNDHPERFEEIDGKDAHRRLFHDYPPTFSSSNGERQEHAYSSPS